MPNHPIECRVGAKITLEQCRKRQIVMRRWDMKGKIDAHFISCSMCEHWIPDEEYVATKKATKKSNAYWIWAGTPMMSERLKGGKGKKCRKI